MKKSIITFIFLFAILNCLFAQKVYTSLTINAGTTICLTQSKNYTPGVHAGAIFAYGVSKKKNDAVTVAVAYQTIKFKFAQSGGLNMTDIKFGYRFFPSSKTAVYLHPNLGIGFFSGSYGGKQANVNAGVALGFLPKVGSGNLNVFAAFNRFRFNPGLSLLHLGVGYQFNFKGK